MKIGMLSQWYDPEPGPAAIPGVLAREFVRAGHQVRVLTGFPNYPHGQIYDGYRLQPKLVEDRDGVRITRVALHPEHSRSALGRVANYGSFALSASTLGAAALRGADAMWVYNSPVTVTMPLLAHSKLGATPYFLHVQDLWPDSLIHSGMFPQGRVGNIAERVVDQIVHTMERRACVIGVISPGVRQLILDRHPDIDPGKIVYAPNPTNEQLFVPVRQLRDEQAPSNSAGPVTFMYAGAIGDVQGFETLLDAASLLRDRDDIRIVLVGDGISRERLENQAREDRLTNVSFVGRVEQGEIPAMLAQADVQLVSLGPDPFLEYTTPSKIQSLLASEVPIVAHIAGDGARLLESAGAGVTVTPGDAEGLASALISMVECGAIGREAYAKAGREYYERELSAAATAATVLQALQDRMK